MAQSRKRVQIGENTYFIRKFNAFTALEILGDLQKRFLAPLLPAIDAAGSAVPKALVQDDDGSESADAKAATAAATEAAIMAGLGKLSSSLSGRELRSLAESLIDGECVSVALGGASDQDAVKLDKMVQMSAFGDPSEVLELCVEIVRLNFNGIFTRAVALIGAGRSLAAAKSSGSLALN